MLYTGALIVRLGMARQVKIVLKDGDKGLKKNLIPTIQKKLLKYRFKGFLRFDDTALFSVVCANVTVFPVVFCIQTQFYTSERDNDMYVTRLS